MTRAYGTPVGWLDTETTGLDLERDWPVEVAIARQPLAAGLDPELRYRKFVRAPVPSHPDALAIHGLADDGLALNGFDPPAVGRDVIGHLRKLSVVAGWNVAFDLVMLRKLVDASSWPCVLPAHVLDVRVWAKRLWPEESGRLADVAARMGIRATIAHRAAPDAMTCARVAPGLLRRLIDARHLPTNVSLQKLAETTRAWALDDDRARPAWERMEAAWLTLS